MIDVYSTKVSIPSFAIALLFSAIIHATAFASTPTYNLRIWSSVSVDDVSFQGATSLQNEPLSKQTIYLKQSTGKLSEVLKAERSSSSQLQLIIAFTPINDQLIQADITLTHEKSKQVYSYTVSIDPETRNEFRLDLKENNPLYITIDIARNFSMADICLQYKQKGLSYDQLPSQCLQKQ